MTMTMAELTAARSTTLDRDLIAEEEPSMTNPVLTDDQTVLVPQTRATPRPMELAPPTNHVTVCGYIYPQTQHQGGGKRAEGERTTKTVATTRAWRQDLAQPVLERLDLLVMEEDGSTYLL